jgi:quinol monooxygenase YgiN
MTRNKLSYLKRRRIEHVTYLTTEIYSSTAELYESFMDEEYKECKKQTKQLIHRLKEILESLEDEI